ncbi:MAG TPA: endonuclease III [Polyangiaceae bacterium]|nr:endonuclease III [Polyangiaceae bacterium]
MAKSAAVRAAPQTFARLVATHPDAHCELVHESPFQLLVATVLSAQSTDVAVNKATPGLFAKFPSAAALASAPQAVVEKLIGSLGMFRQKSKNIINLSAQLCAEHGGQVPDRLDALVALSGVGRKTANVVLGVAFGKPEGVVVDTHVQRISQRLGWSKQSLPEKIEQDLMRLFPQEQWDRISHTLIFHGRRVCTARSPACAACSIADACPSAFKAENIGRKPARTRAPKVAKKAAHSPAATKKAARRSAATKKAAQRSGASQAPKKRARR